MLKGKGHDIRAGLKWYCWIGLGFFIIFSTLLLLLSLLLNTKTFWIWNTLLRQQSAILLSYWFLFSPICTELISKAEAATGFSKDAHVIRDVPTHRKKRTNIQKRKLHAVCVFTNFRQIQKAFGVKRLRNYKFHKMLRGWTAGGPSPNLDRPATTLSAHSIIRSQSTDLGTRFFALALALMRFFRP